MDQDSVSVDYCLINRSRDSPGPAADPPTNNANSVFANAQNIQINGSTFTIVGGDVFNHHGTAGAAVKRTVQAALEAIPNFRKIYQDMLGKATEGTGLWLLKGDKFRIWLEPNGDIKILWGSGIRRSFEA